MEEAAELVELETAPEAGVRGLRVARDPQGLYVTEAPKSLRVHQGDRLLSARVFFEGAPPEEVKRVLEGLGSCKVSLCLRRRIPAGRASGEGRRGKGSRPSIPFLTPSKAAPPAPSPASAAPPGAVAVELALPKLPKLLKSRSAAEAAPPAASPAVPPAPEPKRPRAPPSRLTVKEAAAGKTPAMEEPPAKAELPGGAAAEVPVATGPRLPAVEVAAPKISVGLSLAGAAPPAAPQAKEPAFRLPRVEVAVPVLPLPAAPPAPGPAISQPQIKPGEPKPKVPNLGAAQIREDEGDAGTPGGFAGICVPSIAIAIPSAAVELGVPKPEPVAAGGERPRLEVKPPARSESPAAAAPVRLTLPAAAVPSIDIAVPRVDVGLALPAVPDEGDGAATSAGFAKGLRKLSLELEPVAALPAVEIAGPARLGREGPITGAKPKPSKFALPRFGLSLAKLKTGGDGNGHPPATPGGPAGIAVSGPAVALDLALGTVGGAGAKLKVPKLSLAPFGVKGAGGEEGPRDGGAAMKAPRLGGAGGPRGKDGGSAEPGSPRLRVPRVGIALPALGNRRAPSLPKLPTTPELSVGAKLPKFGGSSPDIRGGGEAKAVRRGGSAESLSAATAGRKTPASPGVVWSKPKTKGARGDGGAQAPTPRFAVPEVGFTVPATQAEKMPKPVGVSALKVPALELAPPGTDGMEEGPPGKDTTAGRCRSGIKSSKFGGGLTGSGREGEGRMRMSGVKAAMMVLVKPKEKGEDGGGSGGGGAAAAAPRPHINGEAEGKARRRRWVPRVGFTPGGSPPEPPEAQAKGGRMRFPAVELFPGHPPFNRGREVAPPHTPLPCGGVGGRGGP